MSISDLSSRLQDGLLDFAWNEWSQMGVLAAPDRRSRWAEDPEALIVLTLEVARRDPRLFGEVLDWLVVNESLVSIRRMRQMCTSSQDKRLVEAVLAWLARHRPRSQAPPSGAPSLDLQELEPLYVGLGAPLAAADESFRALGFGSPQLTLSGKSSRPDVRAPINFAFRLRLLLGVGARAETMRFLLSAEAPRFTTQVVSRAAGYAKRNVQEALTSLRGAGVVEVGGSGVEQWFVADKSAWLAVLELRDGFPAHRDWPQLFSSLRQILRWLDSPGLEDLSSYMRDSQALDLLEAVQDDLRYAGLPVSRVQTAADALPALEQIVGRLLEILDVPSGDRDSVK
jgi:hypothetical protein